MTVVPIFGGAEIPVQLTSVDWAGVEVEIDGDGARISWPTDSEGFGPSWAEQRAVIGPIAAAHPTWRLSDAERVDGWITVDYYNPESNL